MKRNHRMMIVYDFMRREAIRWYKDNPNKSVGVDRNNVSDYDVVLYFKIFHNIREYKDD